MSELLSHDGLARFEAFECGEHTPEGPFDFLDEIEWTRTLAERYADAELILGQTERGPDVCRYVQNVAGVPADVVRQEGWCVYEPRSPHSTDLLLVPARGAGRKTLAHRALWIGHHGEPLASRSWAEAAPGSGLTVDDVPTPFETGLLDHPAVVAVRSPVDALALRVLRDAGEDGLTSAEVVEARRRDGAGPGRTSVDKTLRALVSERAVERTGRGSKGSPFRFRLRSLSSPPIGGDE